MCYKNFIGEVIAEQGVDKCIGVYYGGEVDKNTPATGNGMCKIMEVNATLVLVLKSKILKQGCGMIKEVFLFFFYKGCCIWRAGRCLVRDSGVEVVRLVGKHCPGRRGGRGGCEWSLKVWCTVGTPRAFFA